MQNKLTPRFLLIGLVLVWGFWSLWPTIKLQNLSDDEKDVLRVEGKLEEIETKANKVPIFINRISKKLTS